MWKWRGASCHCTSGPPAPFHGFPTYLQSLTRSRALEKPYRRLRKVSIWALIPWTVYAQVWF